MSILDEVEVRIDLKPNYGIEAIRIYADDSEQREACLRALLSINDELNRIETKFRKDSR